MDRNLPQEPWNDGWWYRGTIQPLADKFMICISIKYGYLNECISYYIRASSATKDLEGSKVCCEGCALGMRG